jgi:O-antigen/teichoic acid export membrane protein
MAFAALRRRGVRFGRSNAPRAYASATIRRFWLLETVVAASTQVDVLLLNAFVPIEQVGFYVAAKRLAGVLGFFTITANFVIAPRLSELHTRGEHAELQRQLAYGALLATVPAACGFLVLLLVPSTLMGLFGPGFAAHGLLLVLCGLAQLVGAACGPVAVLLNQTGHELITLRTRVATLIASVLLGVPLCLAFEAVGAALTQVSLFLLWSGAMYLWTRRHTPYEPTVLALPSLWRARPVSAVGTAS